jgi:hypothetical protein
MHYTLLCFDITSHQFLAVVVTGLPGNVTILRVAHIHQIMHLLHAAAAVPLLGMAAI